jgi:hypothetical protein
MGMGVEVSVDIIDRGGRGGVWRMRRVVGGSVA